LVREHGAILTFPSSRKTASTNPSAAESISPCDSGHNSMVSVRPGSASGRPRSPRSRTRQQEPAGARIAVHLALDGQQQFRHPLDLIDHQQAVMPDECAGIRIRCGAHRLIVKVQLTRVRRPGDDQFRQGALADLPGAVDHYVRARSAEGYVADLPITVWPLCRQAAAIRTTTGLSRSSVALDATKRPR
jgi:hypothetical protein